MIYQVVVESIIRTRYYCRVMEIEEPEEDTIYYETYYSIDGRRWNRVAQSLDKRECILKHNELLLDHCV